MPPTPAGPGSVTAVLLDVNETLTDTAQLAGAFEAVGAPGHLAPTWFASTLRDGFALTLHGAPAPFADVARAAARTALAGAGLSGADLEEAAGSVVAAVGQLPLHPDVAPGLAALRAAGLRVAALSQGAVPVTRGLLEAGGVAEHVEVVLSVLDAPGRAWKPSPSAYAHALDALGLAPAQVALVAVHPWDVDGAQRAGLRGAWVDRAGQGGAAGGAGSPWPAVLREPDARVATTGELPAALAALG